MMLSDDKLPNPVVLLHGTDGSPQDCWLPWLKADMELQGHTVWAPQLPSSHTPNREIYQEFLLSQGWDFTDNILVGYSSGATTVLNLLQSGALPRVDTAVLTGVFLNETLTAHLSDDGQFDQLWPPNGFNVELLRRAARRYIFVHGDDDPYCSYEDARGLAAQLGAMFITIPGGKHLNGVAGCMELPELLAALAV